MNGSTYVGQHSQPSFNEKYFGSGIILNNAMKKYGRDNFNVEVIEFCKDKATLNSREIYYIGIEKKNKGNKCYNTAAGGHSGNTLAYMTKEQYENFCEKFRGSNNGMYGKGHLITDEKNGMLGKKHSEDSKLKMSRKRKDHKNPRSRMILVDFVETNCKMIFSTMRDAIMVLGSNRSTITYHARTGKIRKNIGYGRKSIAPHYISYMEGGN